MLSIRNFAIIAHVDHGKSTLADRFLEITGVVKAGSHEEQFLDRNPISRERGITIKLAPVRMKYGRWKMGIEAGQEDGSKISLPYPTSYILNLIDTPGHVDFSYEVDRTLACVEGVILLVDATQGIQAQTIANAYKALEKNLIIIPVINKIDLPSADPEKTKKQLADFLNINHDEIFEVSAKTGEGVKKLLETVIQKIPPSSPQATRGLSTACLIFDSYYDVHRGIIVFIRVFNGEVKKGTKVKLCNGSADFIIDEVGVFNPELEEKESLVSGEIGYIVTNLKDIREVRVGDTVVGKNDPVSPLPGYKKIKPMVFASVFATDTGDYPKLKKALEKLYLNDSSLEFSAVYSKSLGAGFRVGFLGLLHADVVRERLEREFNLSLLLTPPKIDYHSSHDRENNGKGNGYLEPYVKVMIVVPENYLGVVMQLAQNYRAKFITMENKAQLILTYEMPMSELISDFFDNLKSVSSGYASLDWEFLKYEKVEASLLEVLLNLEPVEEFSEIVVKEKAQQKAVNLTKRLKEIIPRQQYEVKIQAKYKGKIIASERVAPYRKDVTAKLYGGDRTRKDKLLEKQKEGKKKLKMIGKIEIPKEAFMKLFRRN